MKIRLGFISNSSSSSFIINKCDLTENQIEQIMNHVEVACKNNWIQCGSKDSWTVRNYHDQIQGETSMTNFDMTEFLELIKVNPEVIQWE